MVKSLKIVGMSVLKQAGIVSAALWLILVGVVPSSTMAQAPEASVAPEPAESGSSDATINKAKLTKAREEAKLFEDLRKKVRACFLDKRDNYATQGCFRGVNAQGTPRIDQKCKKRNITKFELDCERDIRGKIPYRERPKWDESRREKVERLQQRLDKLDGKVVKKAKKDKKSKKKGQPEVTDKSWITEME